MFWGKNLKSNETYSLDSDKTMLDSVLNITNISLSDALDNTKYYIKIQDNNQIFQVCSLDKTKDSITSSLTFQIKKGMKISVKGGNRGTISFVGFLENFPNEDLEEINTDKEKETKVIKKQEKKEVTPEINRGAIKEIDTGKEIKENKEKNEIKEDKIKETKKSNNKKEDPKNKKSSKKELIKETKELNKLYYITDIYFFDSEQAVKLFDVHYKIFTKNDSRNTITKSKLYDYFIKGIATGTEDEVHGDKAGLFLDEFNKFYVVRAAKKSANKKEYDS
jgi:hypothetical protein